MVRYDAAMACAGGAAVTNAGSRRRNPPTGPSTVAPAINVAANRVAMEVAQWVAALTGSRRGSSRPARTRPRQSWRPDDPFQFRAHQRGPITSNRRQRPSDGTRRAATCGLSLSTSGSCQRQSGSRGRDMCGTPIGWRRSC